MTCKFEPNSSFEKHEDQLPFPLSLLKLRGLTEVSGRCAVTCKFEPDSGFEKHEDRLPFPLALMQSRGLTEVFWTMCCDLRIRVELKL